MRDGSCTVRITPIGGAIFGGVISGELVGTVGITFVGAPKVTRVTATALHTYHGVICV